MVRIGRGWGAAALGVLCGCWPFWYEDWGDETESETASGTAGQGGPGGSGATSGGATSGGATSGGATGGESSSGGGSGASGSTSGGSTSGESGEQGGGFEQSPLAAPVTTQVFDFLLMAIGDVDGDGRADLIAQGTGWPSRVTIYPGRHDGSFGEGVMSEVFGFNGLVAGDLNGDGAADVITAGTGAPPRVNVYMATPGSLALGGAVTTTVWSFDPLRMGAVDLDGDGRMELVLDNNQGAPPKLFFYASKGQGSGSLVILGEVTTWLHDARAVGDFDGDGLGDVITGVGSNFPRIWMWRGDGSGGVSAAIESAAKTFSKDRMVAGDLDGDGRVDVITDVPNNAWRLQLFRGLGDGRVAAPVIHEGWNFTALAAGDVNGDGRADVITRSSGWPPRVDVYVAK